LTSCFVYRLRNSRRGSDSKKKRTDATHFGDRFEDADAPPPGLMSAVRAAPVPDAARLIAEETVAASGNGSRVANVGGESSSPWGEHGVRGDDLAEDLAKFVEWPVRYDVEVVSKSALLRNLPPELDVSGRSPDADGEEKETHRTRPFVGIAVAPWLRWAALREKEDDLADHAAAPHLRKRWRCPQCGKTMMAFYQESDKHRERCGLPEEARDPKALPANFGKGGACGPSLQEELAGGANLGLPRESLSLRAPVEKEVTEVEPPEVTKVDLGGHVNLFDGGGDTGGGDKPSGPTRSFECGKCGKTLELTTIEILKHKRSCRG